MLRMITAGSSILRWDNGMMKKLLVALSIVIAVAVGCAQQGSPVSGTPTISYGSSSYTFTATAGGSNPSPQMLEIWNSGGGILSWSVSHDVNWLTLNPITGSSADEHASVTISVDISGMSAGSYTAAITISSPGATNTAQVVSVSLAIDESDSPTISYSSSSYTFTATAGGSNPANQTLEIWNSGGDILNWSVSHDVDWLNLSPTSGSSTDEGISVAISVEISGMSAGSYSAIITVSAPDATNTPQTVSVGLTIDPSPLVEEFLKPGRVVEHPPTDDNPYTFYSYFPRSATTSKEIWLCVWPHDGGEKSEDYSVHITQAAHRVRSLTTYAEDFRMPILVAAIPNVPHLYVHSLHPGTFTTTEEMLRRPDLKLIDAVWSQYIPLMQTAGLTVNERVLMLGYSSVGTFAHRFTMLHPDRVHAVWLGGESPAPLPTAELYEQPLDYPLGIRNLEALTGKPFDLETYMTVRHFICVGENDVKPENDATTYTDIFTEEQRLFIRSYFGATNPERIRFFYEYLVSVGVPAEFRLYEGMEHVWTPQVFTMLFDDAFGFLARSTG